MAKMYGTTLEITNRYTVRFEAESQQEAESVLDLLDPEDFEDLVEGETDTVIAHEGEWPTVFVITCDQEKAFEIHPKPKEIAS